MRIGMIAPLNESVPPQATGGIETAVSLLTEELVKRGHRVILYASGDSRTAAELRSFSPLSFRGLGRPSVLLDFAHTAKAFRDAAEACDIIHNHSEFFGLGLRDLSPVPVLTTIHSLLETQGAEAVHDAFRNTPCTALTEAHRRALPRSLHIPFVIPHGLHVDEFPFQAEKDDFLLFLGRMHPQKGPELAIEAARQAGMRLVIASRLDVYNPWYWENVIRPQIDGRQILYVGEADATAKLDLLRRARALLFPVQWDEPFGLAMVEALACGTPVIGLRRGSVPEVVRDGETGFVAETVSGLVHGIRNAHRINPQACRQDVQERFSVGRMADDYLAAYRTLGERPVSGTPHAPWPAPAVQRLTAELADYFACSEGEAATRLARAPALLCRAWWEALPGDSGRQAFFETEPLWVYERANQVLMPRYQDRLAEVARWGVREGLENWLCYRSDLSALAGLVNGRVTVAERPGHLTRFLRWRLARQGRDLPFVEALPVAAFDGIVAFDPLTRDEDPAAAFAALVRALRPGGWLFLSDDLPFELDEPWVRRWPERFQVPLNPRAFGLEAIPAGRLLLYRRLAD